MTTLYLLKGVNLDPQYETTIDFNNKVAQVNYFSSNFNKMVHDSNLTYSYLRTAESIDVPYSYEDLEEVNYLYYINHTKAYYCFVTDKEYVNPSVTRLSIKLDVFQTFMFDYELGECFVEREHQDRVDNNLAFIFNKESENIDTGRYLVTNYKTNLGDVNLPSGVDLSYYYVVSTKELGSSTYTDTANTTMYNYVDTNFYVYCLPRFELNTGNGNLYYKDGNDYQILEVGTAYEYGRAEALLKVWCEDPAVISVSISKVPPFVTNLTAYNGGYYISPINTRLKSLTINGYDFTFYFIQLRNMFTSACTLGEIVKPTGVNAFNTITLGATKDIAREPKLYTYPYNFNRLTFGDNRLEILNEMIDGVKVTLKGYKTIGAKSTELLIADPYLPDKLDNYMVNISINELSLRNDSWLTYLNNNRASVRSGLAVNVLTKTATGIAGGAISGGWAGAIAGALIGSSSAIADEMIKRENYKESADTLRNTGDDVGANKILNNFKGQVINCGLEATFKNKVFNYFYRQGYRCANYKVPNTKSRYYFNFIKTTECCLLVNKVASSYADTLKQIYNKGVTIWHYRDANTFAYMDYSLENWETNLIGGGE